MGQHLRSIGWNVFFSHTPGILVITSTPSDSSRLCKWAQRLINPLPTRIPLCVIDFHDVICSLAWNERIKFDCHFWISDSLSNGYIQSELQLLIFFHRFESVGGKNEWKSPRANWVFWRILVLLATEASALNGDKRKPIPSIAFLTWTWTYSSVTNRLQQ